MEYQGRTQNVISYQIQCNTYFGGVILEIKLVNCKSWCVFLLLICHFITFLTFVMQESNNLVCHICQFAICGQFILITPILNLPPISFFLL